MTRSPCTKAPSPVRARTADLSVTRAGGASRDEVRTEVRAEVRTPDWSIARSMGKRGRIAALTATTALALTLPLSSTASASLSRSPSGAVSGSIEGSGSGSGSDPVSDSRAGAGAGGGGGGEGPVAVPAPAPSAAKPDGPIESSLSVAGTGLVAAVSTVLIVRRHQRRNRKRR
ncbi:hypothetical protein [Streptomyces sp. NPDC004726]